MILTATSKLLALGLALSFAAAAVAAIPSSERSVLLAIYASAGGPGWTDRTNWNGPSGSECTWYGITCDPAGDHVQYIVLQTNNLVGTLPPLSPLTNLVSFLVNNDPALPGSANRLTGPLPSLSGLTKLQDFSADDNQFTGQLPTFAGLPSLSFFGVRSNRLTGPIPSLTESRNLHYLGVEDNQLTGSIPSLAGVRGMRVIVVSGNQLSGPIPSLDGLADLEGFFANGNQLSGPIPPLAGLSKLRRLWIHDNQLSGAIPSLAGLASLRDIDVSNNQLTGDVPGVPIPNSLTAGASRLCPNLLDHKPDPAWNAATGTTPWYLTCTGGQTTFTGPTATGAGPATARLACSGTSTCSFTKAAWLAPPGSPAAPPLDPTIADVSFPNGLFDFTVTGGDAGFSATLTINFPQPLPPGTAYYKFGPTPDDRTPHWYKLPAVISGSVATFTIADGMLGDDDLIANGVIADAGGPASNIVTVVEYYHATFDHYFVTAKPDEIAKLDSGVFVGWARTGLTFNAHSRAAAGALPVCRFFSTAFGPRSSHFYTPFADECTDVKANPNWQFEAAGDDTFYIRVAASDGTCAPAAIPIYRLYNDGQGGAPNHRYTADIATRDLMMSHRWDLEGNGPGLAFMCAP